MIYNQFKDKKISALGLGTMRFPVIGGKYGEIDEQKTEEIVEYAIKNGINYFDTAYGYHEGNSEKVIGKMLSKYPRESFYLADKFPGYDKNNFLKKESIFEEQLKKCGVDYFDFYLFHCVDDKNIEYYLNPEYKLKEYAYAQKQAGKIKHLGFSVHSNESNFLRFLEYYGDIIEFCQIQLNYVDYDFQNAKFKLEELNKRNIPVWVMEPVRGGKLAQIKQPLMDELKALRPSESACGWAFRYLQSFDCVKVILSGMSTLEQVVQNVQTFNSYEPLNEDELKTIYSVGKRLIYGVPCTNCKYCTAYCPQSLDIPALIKTYNECTFNGYTIHKRAIEHLSEDKMPSACLSCGKCSEVCPQSINIPDVLEDFNKRIEK
ncbi:MAG: aldo/keto reductase [Clostridia bacterium]|nr:aldo/keto reductase [Clostridia bacterium]